jgi:hypothetical protein
VNSTGRKETLLLINAWVELRERANIFTTGNKQRRIKIKHIKAITKSSNFRFVDLTIMPLPPYHTPRSPNFLAMALALNRNTTHIKDWNKPTAAVSENWKPRIPTRYT